MKVRALPCSSRPLLLATDSPCPLRARKTGGVFPGALYALTLFYPPDRLPPRIAAFTLAASLAFAAGSFGAGVLLPVGDDGWRVLFVLRASPGVLPHLLPSSLARPRPPRTTADPSSPRTARGHPHDRRRLRPLRQPARINDVAGLPGRPPARAARAPPRAVVASLRPSLLLLLLVVEQVIHRRPPSGACAGPAAPTQHVGEPRPREGRELDPAAFDAGGRTAGSSVALHVGRRHGRRQRRRAVAPSVSRSGTDNNDPAAVVLRDPPDAPLADHAPPLARLPPPAPLHHALDLPPAPPPVALGSVRTDVQHPRRVLVLLWRRAPVWRWLVGGKERRLGVDEDVEACSCGSGWMLGGGSWLGGRDGREGSEGWEGRGRVGVGWGKRREVGRGRAPAGGDDGSVPISLSLAPSLVARPCPVMRRADAQVLARPCSPGPPATPTLGSLYLSFTVGLPPALVPNKAILTACVICRFPPSRPLSSSLARGPAS